MKITNNTTIYIPKYPLHLFSARELCRSMDSNPCSLPITMTILEEENVEYFTNYKLATDRESIFCVFSSYDITIDNVCLFQLGKMKEEYQLQGIPVDKASIIKLLGSNDEGIVTVTKISSEYFMGLSVDTKGVILPCCTTTPSQTEAEILLQGHFQEKLEKTERKLSRIEHHMTQTSNRKKRSLWSFLGIASENEVITLNTNVMNNFDSLKSQGLAITEVSNSQKDITKQLNEEATVLNALNNREQNLESNLYNLTQTLSTNILNTSYQLNTITKQTNFILLLLDLSDKIAQIDRHLDLLLDYINCDNYCPDKLLEYDRNKYLGNPTSITVDSNNYNLTIRYILHQQGIMVYQSKCIPYMASSSVYKKIDIPELIAIDKHYYLDISKSSCDFKAKHITCNGLLHRQWRKDNFECIKAITTGNFSKSCISMTKTYDKPEQDILLVDDRTVEIFTPFEDTITIICQNYTHMFELKLGTNLVNGTCAIETSTFYFNHKTRTGFLSHKFRNYLNYSRFDRILHQSEVEVYNTSNLDHILALEEHNFKNLTSHINDTTFTSVSILHPLKPLFINPTEYWYHWVFICLAILLGSTLVVLSCYYRWCCCIITKCFRRSTFSYDPAPQFHCSTENLELMETSVNTQNYSWELENHPGYKILVLKNDEGVVMGMFDKKWINTLPSFARDRVPHIPKNIIDSLTPNMNVTPVINPSTKRIEISEFNYHYSEINGPGWYNNQTKLPSYAFPMPNYRLRAKLMALARKNASH